MYRVPYQLKFKYCQIIEEWSIQGFSSSMFSYIFIRRKLISAVRGSSCRRITFLTLGMKPAISCYEDEVQCRRCSVVLLSLIFAYIYEGVVGSGMGLFLIGGHWPKILRQNSKGASLMCVLCMCTVYSVAEICARLAGNFCQ